MIQPKPAPFSICVYCGSRAGVDPAHAAVARQVGRWLGEHGGQLVYGGGRGGLMGIVADAALAAGAPVIGIIPQALVDKEHAHRGCTELHIVANMHERKAMMAERAQAFLALPGGIGTFEELFEVWTWRQLGYHDKPIGVLDHGGYYQPLREFMAHTVRAGFVSDWQMELIRIGSDAPALLAELAQAIATQAPQAARPLAEQI